MDLNYFINVIFRLIWKATKEIFCNRKRRQMGNAMHSIKAVCVGVGKVYLVLIWGTQCTAGCSDLSEISQQSRGRTLSHLVHLKRTYEWHMAMHSPLIYLYIYGAEAPEICLTGKAHRHTSWCLWYMGFCFIIYLCFDILWECHLSISRTWVLGRKTFMHYGLILSTLF